MGDAAGDASEHEAGSSKVDRPALHLPIRQRDRTRAYSMSLSTESPRSCWRACSHWTGKQRLLVFALALLDFCGFACLSVMGPFFPVEADKKGVSQHVTGLIFSSYAFTAFLFAPVWGKLVPRIGPKCILMAGGTIAGVACIGFGLLYWIEDMTTFVASCFVVRIVEALGFAAFNTAVFTTVAKMFPETMGTVMAALEIAIGSGLAIGPVIGSGMFAAGGYVAPFVSLGVLLLITVVFLYFAIPSAREMSSHGPEEDERRPQMSSWTILTSYSSILVCFTIAANAMGIAFLIPILAFHVGEIGIGEDKAGVMFMCHLGMYAIFAPLSGHLSDRYPTKRFLLIGIGLLVFGVGHVIVGPSPLFGTAAVNSLATNIIGLIVIGIGSAFALVPTFPALICCATDRGFPDGIGTYALMGGLWNSVCALGDMVGPTLAASINEVYGFAVATSVCGALLLILGTLVVAHHYAKHMRLPSPRVDKALAKYPEETERLLSGNNDAAKL